MKAIRAGGTAAVLAVAMLGAVVAYAQETPKPSAGAAQVPAGEPESGPTLADVMAQQQMRHIKLWFAGHNGNWPLADYELDQIGGGFEDITKMLGGDLVDKAVGQALRALQKAVDDKDGGAFAAAFDQLSAGCNGCHQTLDHAFIVIQRPTLLPYSDQRFAPAK